MISVGRLIARNLDAPGLNSNAPLAEAVLEDHAGEIMPRKAYEAARVVLSDRQRRLLEKWVRNASGTSHRLRERCRIVLMSSDGHNNEEQARQLGIDRQRVRRWRTRWSEHQQRLADAEAESVVDKDLVKLMKAVLGDAPRPGGPHTFTAEQVAQIISVACEPPETHGLPVSHWTPHELAAVVMARGIVETISERQVGRFLARATSGQIEAGTG